MREELFSVGSTGLNFGSREFTGLRVNGPLSTQAWVPDIKVVEKGRRKGVGHGWDLLPKRGGYGVGGEVWCSHPRHNINKRLRVSVSDRVPNRRLLDLCK